MTKSNGATAINQHTLDEVVGLFTAVVSELNPPEKLPPSLAGQDRVLALFNTLLALRNLADALAQGDLGYEVDAHGFMAGTLKGLQANLRHLTWQAQQVAAGDLTQRVDFMGDFSDAFNTMIDRLAEAHGELVEMASLDPLTGLLNRRSFFTMARAEWERSIRNGHPLSLLMLDLDHFKAINDTYGHAVGDKVLAAVAIACADGLRSADGIGRYGGEEIVLLLPETGLDGASVVANRLCQTIADRLIETDAGPVSITVSIGVSCSLPMDLDDVASGDGLAEMVVQADAALYRAKREGRNTVRIWED